jgi:hypothetical protein
MTTPPPLVPLTQFAFRAPGSLDWQDLPPAPEGDMELAKLAKANQSDLNNMLLASLQMSHVVVLAGSGCSIPIGGPSMADLWNRAIGSPPSELAVATAAKVKHDLAVPNIEVLLSRIESYLQLQDDPEVVSFLRASKKLILDSCSSFLEVGDLEPHKILLHRLGRRRARDQRLRVFTTNYDLCFEQAAARLGFVAIDGFAFASPRQYDPRFFSYDIVRRPNGTDDVAHFLEGVFVLYKLHGSVNWSRNMDGTIVEVDDPDPDAACLIYPASGKYQQSYSQPYLEAISQYLTALREPNTCVVVAGFGFSDDHLAEPILSAVRSNPHLRLIVADSRAKSNSTLGNQHWKELSKLAEKGEDVWLLNIDFSTLGQAIPDLKSLSPADSLVRALRGIVG